jgi:hypothetical protein
MISVKTVKSNGYNEVYILENGVVFLYDKLYGKGTIVLNNIESKDIQFDFDPKPVCFFKGEVLILDGNMLKIYDLHGNLKRDQELDIDPHNSSVHRIGSNRVYVRSKSLIYRLATNHTGEKEFVLSPLTAAPTFYEAQCSRTVGKKIQVYSHPDCWTFDPDEIEWVRTVWVDNNVLFYEKTKDTIEKIYIENNTVVRELITNDNESFKETLWKEEGASLIDADFDRDSRELVVLYDR